MVDHSSQILASEGEALTGCCLASLRTATLRACCESVHVGVAAELKI